MKTPAPAVASDRTIVALGSVGPYKIEAIVRGGAAWTTFKAIHQTVGHAAWLTMTPPSIQPSATSNQRLVLASVVLAKLGFESVLGLRDVIDEGERTVVITQAPKGPSVAELILTLADQRDLSVEHRAAAALLLARAVADVHDAGVVHGALCPQNAFVTERGSIKLAGFWEARVIGQEAPATDRDVPDAGPEERYRSPERIAGAIALDRSADVFSLGMIAYELVTGRHPFEEERNGQSLARRIRGADADPSDAPLAIDQVLRKCMQRVPSLRYETARRLADDLTAALGGARRAGDLERGLIARLRGKPEVPVAPPDAHVSRLAKRLAMVTGLMILVGGFVVAGDERFADSSAKAKGAASARVRVLARPWADVYVDGDRVDTTPIGEPLTMTPGRHEIVLKHPRAPDERRLLDLQSGDTVTVDVDMDVKRPAVDAGIDNTP